METTTNLTPELIRLAHMMAAEQTTPELREDAAQEAMIAAWKALEAGKDPGLVRADMRRAAMDVDRGRSMTGNRRKPGANGTDVHARYAVPLVRHTEDGAEALAVDPEDPGAALDLWAVELRQAMDTMDATARDLARLRLQGYTVAAAGRVLGIPPSTAHERWHKARTHLAAELTAA